MTILTKKQEDKVKELLECLRDGGGRQIGVGDSPESYVTMTNATECYWGTSGRGNPQAKRRIEAAATLGFVNIVRYGRSQRVSISQRGYDLLRG